MALWGVFIFSMRSSPDVEHALMWDKLVAPLIFFVPALYYHFTVVYSGVSVRTGAVAVVYLLPAITIALAPTSVLMDGMTIQSYGYSPEFGLPMYFLTLVLYAVLAASCINLFRAYRASGMYEKRNRLLYLIGAMGFVMLGGVFEFFPTSYPSAMFGNLLFCMITAVAILRYNLLDVRVAIRKGTAYLLMSALVAIPYVGLIMGMSRMLGTSGASLLGQALLLVLLAFGLVPLWGGVQRVVDRWFYRERYDYLKALEDFSHEAHDIRELDQLATSLVRLIGRALQTSGVYLLLPSGSGAFGVISSLSGVGPAEFRLEGYSALLQWMRFNGGILHRGDLDTQPLLQTLSYKERDELERAKAQLLVPLKTKEKELVGVLVLSEKLSQQPYSEEDERLVSTVASRMAVELENSRLYTVERTMRGELQKQNEQKTEFLHGVAHELKTPLTAIISSSELMDQGVMAASEAQKGRLVRNIAKSAWRMDKRITELLEYARMQTGGLELSAQPVEVQTVIRDVASQLSVLFDNKGQGFWVELPDVLPTVEADKAKLEQVLINLLENANKFSPDGGDVIVRAKHVDTRVVVEVDDSAVAISEEEREKVFDPYYRGEDADKRQRLPGLGLGLAISKQLVELHEGEIWVESASGKGNRFAFSLPAKV